MTVWFRFCFVSSFVRSFKKKKGVEIHIAVKLIVAFTAIVVFRLWCTRAKPNSIEPAND